MILQRPLTHKSSRLLTCVLVGSGIWKEKAGLWYKARFDSNETHNETIAASANNDKQSISEMNGKTQEDMNGLSLSAQYKFDLLEPCFVY